MAVDDIAELAVDDTADPSADDAAKFGNSPEYAPVKKIRETAADTLSSVMVEGYDGKSDNIGS